MKYKVYEKELKAYKHLEKNGLTYHIPKIVYAGKIKNDEGFFRWFIGTKTSNTLKTNFNNCPISNTSKYYGYIISDNISVTSLEEKCKEGNIQEILIKLKEAIDNFIAPLNYKGWNLGNINVKNIVLDEKNNVYFTNYGNMYEYREGYKIDKLNNKKEFINQGARFIDTKALYEIIKSIINNYKIDYKLGTVHNQTAYGLSLTLIDILQKNYNKTLPNPPIKPTETEETDQITDPHYTHTYFTYEY